MPGYKGHLVGGFVAYSLTLYMAQSCGVLSVPLALGGAIMTSIGALFPDIDIKSKGRSFFYKIFFLCCILIALVGLYDLIIPLMLIGLLPLVVRHRGLFHRSWFVIGIALLFIWLCQIGTDSNMVAMYALFFTVGGLSHIWLDSGARGLLRV